MVAHQKKHESSLTDKIESYLHSMHYDINLTYISCCTSGISSLHPTQLHSFKQRIKCTFERVRELYRQKFPSPSALERAKRYLMASEGRTTYKSDHRQFGSIYEDRSLTCQMPIFAACFILAPCVGVATSFHNLGCPLCSQ